MKNWYYDSTCFVFFAGVNSELFKISQGVGQGRMLSAFMFHVYIDDLLYELCTSTNGLLMGSLHIPGILLADDIALISNSPRSLQESLYVVDIYAYKWRLHYNPNKGVSIVFNKQSHISLKLGVQLFDNVIHNCNDVIYAGCLLQANLKSDRLVERACKNAIHSLYPVGVNNSQINPVVSAKIWKRIVLPSSLYSCELWTDLTKKDLSKLKYTQRHFSRIVQGLSKYSPSLYFTSNRGLWSVKGYIDKCRLLFLGRLMRADKTTVHNKLFMFFIFRGCFR